MERNGDGRDRGAGRQAEGVVHPLAGRHGARDDVAWRERHLIHRAVVARIAAIAEA